MPSIYQLKPAFQNLLRPLVQRLYDNGVTANQITLLAGVISGLVGVLIAFFANHLWLFLLVPVWMFLRMALNAIDGMLAREFGQKSRLGAVLNELGDVVSDTALYLPFALIPGLPVLLIALTVCLAIMTEMTGAVALQIGSRRRYDGPFGKSDRAVFFGTFGAILALGPAPGLWSLLLLGLAAAASLLTIINRARAALREA
jgi:CDP-diacylglycerol--glycerol-3-phosphate 3-phosphatidyltransferase